MYLVHTVTGKFQGLYLVLTKNRLYFKLTCYLVQIMYQVLTGTCAYLSRRHKYILKARYKLAKHYLQIR